MLHIPTNRFAHGYADPRAAARDLAIQLATEYVEPEHLDKKALVKLRDERLPPKAKAKAKASSSRRRSLPAPRFAKDEDEKEDEQEERYDFGLAQSGVAAPSSVAQSSMAQHDLHEPSATELGSGGVSPPPPRFHDMCGPIPPGSMSDSESPRTPT